MKIAPGSLVLDGSLFEELKHRFYRVVANRSAFILDEPFIAKVVCYGEKLFVSFRQGSLIVNTEDDEVVDELLDLGACIVMEYAWANLRELNWVLREVPNWLVEDAKKAGFSINNRTGLGTLKSFNETDCEGELRLVKPWHPTVIGMENGDVCFTKCKTNQPEHGDVIASCNGFPALEIIGENEAFVTPLSEPWKALPIVAYVGSRPT
ncbi:hypothetical protein EYM_07255 [Ignicoccus islandicus DSM 13165]|uniref:Uncharacterized protein n=1 Tax=Ignicoccus islandicus DSM 13165 TaxID=940295 RepID=A0A0U3FAQ1_9CREN|nr:hypothetical protein [Ignicoccus islandicus]ALU12761.1 hypothetical protein EYM_07255 [Ignicoccus islandicus DSM 13165]